jgi:prepilin-type N-terminal cleavage/methylation domain-containing protein
MIHVAATSRSRQRGGFTLIEVMATLMLVAIVLPAVMKGASLATSAASTAKRRNEASGLAEEKLAEIIATNQWQGSSLSGDFGSDWPGYRWQATVQSWPQDTSGAGLQQVDLRVSWMARGRPDSLTLSTLTYAQTQTQTP